MNSLGNSKRWFVGRISSIRAEGCDSILPPAELESRLVEMGFVEGARVEILHEGVFGKDPIAVRVDNATVAIRRREAMAIMVD
jgi:ferrous iron transport protein A